MFILCSALQGQQLHYYLAPVLVDTCCAKGKAYQYLHEKNDTRIWIC